MQRAGAQVAIAEAPDAIEPFDVLQIALGQQMVSILRPGIDWTPASPFSDQPGPIEPPVVAMAADGTIITMWVERPGNQTFLITRRFVPAEGWEPIQTLLELTNSGSIEPVPPFIPALAISPDGTGHLVFFNEGNMVAMTLAPGQSGRITVTFTPQGTRGSRVRGTLYVDDFGLRLLTGKATG